MGVDVIYFVRLVKNLLCGSVQLTSMDKSDTIYNDNKREVSWKQHRGVLH